MGRCSHRIESGLFPRPYDFPKAGIAEHGAENSAGISPRTLQNAAMAIRGGRIAPRCCGILRPAECGERDQFLRGYMLKPLSNRLLVERTDSEEVTRSGIIIPDSAKEKPQEGKVKSVGPGSRDKEGKVVPMEISVGDLVLFAKYGGTDVTIEGEEYLILKEDDVLAIIGK